MSNVINLFTREPVQIDRGYSSSYTHIINILAERFDTNCESVTFNPKITINNNRATLRTYKGNLHTGKIPYHNDSVGKCMPLPMNINDYSWMHCLDKIGVDTLILEDECFMYMDKKYKCTLEVLRVLNKAAKMNALNIETIVIRTRSDLFAHDQYLGLLKSLQDSGISIKFNLYGMGISESFNRSKWPGSPSVLRRKRALNKALEALKLRLKAV